MNQPHHNSRSGYIRQLWVEDFVISLKWLGIFVASPMIILGFLKDFHMYGFQLSWTIGRLGYFLYTAFCYYLLFHKKVRRNVQSFAFIGICYFAAYLLLIVSNTGYENSSHINKINQLIFGISFLPFSAPVYFFLSVLIFLSPYVLCYFHYGSFSFFETYFKDSHLANLIAYTFLASLVYLAMRSMRQTIYSQSAELYQQRSNQEKVISDQAEKLSEAKAAIAISRTVQMLAHDVRKPFTKLKSALEIIASANHLKQAKELAQSFQIEVSEALTYVNSMISDVLNISSSDRLHLESDLPERMIFHSLKDIFHYKKDTNIFFSYSFHHQHLVKIDQTKMHRVFSNILLNAAQAMGDNGQIWFHTKEVFKEDQRYIEFTIGNNNSYIEDEDIDQIFEAYYTQNKKEGIGLGLAVVKKIILSHKGTISCSSSRSDGVEFKFTLPASDVLKGSADHHALPNHSRELYALSHSFISAHNDQDLLLVDDLKQQLLQIVTPIKILIVDDEPIYYQLIDTMISRRPHLFQKVSVHDVNLNSNLLENILSLRPDLVLLDIDLGLPQNGFHVAKILRQASFKGIICIHSNRDILGYSQSFQESGADTILPKTISEFQLMRFIHSICKQKNTSCGESPDETTPCLAIVDDDSILLKHWQLISEVNTLIFKSPEEFIHLLNNDSSILNKLDGIVVDFIFDEVASNINGIDLANIIKSKCQSIPIYLASSMEDIENNHNNFHRVSKNPSQAWREIKIRMDQ